MDDDDDYSGDSGPYYGGLTDDDETYCGGLSDAENSHDDDSDVNGIPRYEYTVLNESDIRRQQQDVIARVSGIYSVSTSAATMLLLHYNWSVNKLNDAWLQDEEAVRRSVGLPDQPQASAPLPDLCGICFQSDQNTHSAGCAHPYCSDCWAQYIGSAVEDGPGCLTLRCPEPSCHVAVTSDMILKFAKSNVEKYSKYLVRSYIEDNKSTKWCPAPGCEFAVNFVQGSGGYDVKCLCSLGFCWNCSEEAHQPVDCETVKNWIAKNSAESENVNYILAYTKPCPKCKRPIEKNAGCNHMTCNRSCGHQFCWNCLCSLQNHINCNAYQEDKTAEKAKKRAKLYLERYTHYYERWANNHKSWNKAISDLKEIRERHVEKIMKTQILGSENRDKIAEFVFDAWEQIVECRRVLKWTYAYGYYIDEEEETKKRFFEYLQGQAEAGLERLHGCAEREMEPYLEATCRLESFDAFRLKLVSLTKVTKTYFKNLVAALQNGLADVHETAHEMKIDDDSNQ